MIYIGNGIYSDASPNEYLAHYGVLGMKWGVHRAREHEKNIYRHNIANGMSRQAAKQEYRNRMAGVKQYAKANRKTGMKVKDISSGSHEEARNRISNYDKKLRSQRRRKAALAGLGAAAITGTGLAIYSRKKSFDNLQKGFNISERADEALNKGKDRYELFRHFLKKGNAKKMTQAMNDARRYTKVGEGLESKATKLGSKGLALYSASKALTKGAAAATIGAGTIGVLHKVKNKRHMRQKNESAYTQ